MSEPTQESVQEALAAVLDPTFDKTLGALGTLSDVSVHGARVEATIQLSSPSQKVQDVLRKRVDEAVTPLGVVLVELTFKVSVPTREATSADPIPDVRNVILVVSGKGGVGKSTVAANLALALRRAGTRVGLLDADIYGPSVPTMFGISGHPRSTDGKKIEPLQRFGVKLMSVGFLLEDPKQAIVWRGPMLHGALKQFVTDVDWGPLDYLIVDLPPGTGDVALTLSQMLRVSGAVVVTTPQEVALMDVYKSVSMLQKLNVPVIGIVENMSWFEDPTGARHELFGSGGGEKIAEMAGAPLLAQVPVDPKVREWGDDGTPIVQASPGAAAGKAFTTIADEVATRVAQDAFNRHGGDEAPKAAGPKRLRVLR